MKIKATQTQKTMFFLKELFLSLNIVSSSFFVPYFPSLIENYPCPSFVAFLPKKLDKNTIF
jgi:hypothetical protein